MKSSGFLVLVAGGLLFVVTGCGALTTPSTVTEFDSNGKVTKTTVTRGSVIPSIVESTKNKTVIAWSDGWAGYISISTATQEDPTPTGKIFLGKVNKGAISLLPTQSNLEGIADVLRATRSNVSASLTDGISASEQDTDIK